jgi:hypothetical protein
MNTSSIFAANVTEDREYALRPGDIVLADGRHADLWLHDLPQDAAKLRLQALVASGDYFETLAARLEQIAAAVPEVSVEQYQLQEAVSQLLYLHREYVITKKSAASKTSAQ